MAMLLIAMIIRVSKDRGRQQEAVAVGAENGVGQGALQRRRQRVLLLRPVQAELRNAPLDDRQNPLCHGRRLSCPSAWRTATIGVASALRHDGRSDVADPVPAVAGPGRRGRRRV